jgi:Crp-like helix-turn-helix protein
LAQAQQSAACNATHTLEERLSRWLLRCRDLLDSDDIPLTQEFLAEMLGVRRTSVTLVASILQKAGLIRYQRGHIRLLDRGALLDSALRMLWNDQSSRRPAAGGDLPEAGLTPNKRARRQLSAFAGGAVVAASGTEHTERRERPSAGINGHVLHRI